MKARIILILVVLSALARPASAQMEFPYAVDTGTHSNEGAKERVGFTQVLMMEKVSPLRVHFAAASLGRGSYLRVSSVEDWQEQRLDAATLALWKNSSALFNGNALVLELVVAPGDSNVFARVDRLAAPEPTIPWQPNRLGQVAVPTICGDDDRVPSNDNRVGRLYGGGCTGWLISNGAALTAGHCPGLSGGNVGMFFEVNVPPSDANGVPRASAVIDQFPVTTFTWQNAGVGGDWCIFGLGPNNLGERAHQKFGFFRVTDVVPDTTQDVRITGFGVDTDPTGPGFEGRNSRSFTQQTAVGDVDSLNTDGDLRYFDYDTSTEGATSGSPIIWEQTGWTIGIHTTGNCTVLSDNYGTAFAYGPLFNAVNNWPGPGTRYLDSAIPPENPGPQGTLFRAHHNLLDAWNSAPANATVAVIAASYPPGPGNTGVRIGTSEVKHVRFVAATGPVTLGR